ncbi:hypothetical protein [Streptomyces albus]|uniref:hypothetical protein n=1 Tax=Streptomyces albus TaxID=1888 RepID=UPI001FAE4440|nr:hypothetical protein [Streptomyces albus]
MGERKVPGGGLTVAAVFAAVLAACSGYGAHGGDAGHRGERAAAPAPRLSVAALRKKAAAAGRECPVAYRPGAALRAAGVRGEAARVEGGSVLGELPDGPDEPLTRARGALVDCGYRLGGERARLFTVGVRKGYAVAVLLPQIQHDARLTMDQLRRFARQARDAEPGRPLLAPGGNVARRPPARRRGR